MRYLLVVGFACDVYCKEPQARIFFGNKLIDEVSIQHHKDIYSAGVKKFMKNRHVLQPFSNLEFNYMQLKNFPPLRFYEIEIDQKEQQIELRIEIKNNDSNYNNGFMTRSTLLKLQVCYFFPFNKKLLSRLVKIYEKNFAKKNYGWYRNSKNIIFKCLDNGIEWRGENKQMFEKNLTSETDIGGNGHFFCKFIKKYGIYISKLSRSYRYRLFGTPVIDYFIDKYYEYVNQRNFN